MSDYAIDVEHLVKTFDGKRVVDDVSLRVKTGEIYGFLGPNGSGKTTTIRMICGLLTPDSGSGTCLGLDITTQSEAIKRQVGYMTQHFSLYKDLSVYENLMFMARVYELDHLEERVQKSIDQLGIGRERQKQLAGNLSGGWKQRLSLAAAILHEPKVLLLDEPTAGVDPKARRDFWQEIHNLAQNGITALVSTHYMDEAERCTRLAYLAYGKLLTKGTAEEVIANAHLDTWELSGPHLWQLAEQLRHKPGITQVAAFGARLHVSAPKGNNIDTILAPLREQGYSVEKINADLEDVFIHFMTKREDNFA